MYKIASKAVWLGDIGADEAAAIEKAAAIKVPATRLLALVQLRNRRVDRRYS